MTKKKEATVFKKGTSGNKRGRPKGAKNKKTELQEALLSKTSDLMIQNLNKVVEIVIEKAQGGDLTAAKMIMDRLIPVKKAVEFNMGNGGKGDLIINIAELTANPHVQRNTVDEVDGEYEEIKKRG